MHRDRIAAPQWRDPAVEVGQVGGDDQGGHCARGEALEANPPEQRADEAVGEVVQSAVADQSLCGSFSTIQVWPLLTSFWRSAVLPEAASRFCSSTASSKVGRGSS